jgi:hypothetical protein
VLGEESKIEPSHVEPDLGTLCIEILIILVYNH